ncbi:MAG: hypothetical protein IPG07_13170 [Crocinitomicaceae bacterium]|nr:hypothetical protein [Crocinitomicaceae bacterium]
MYVLVLMGSCLAPLGLLLGFGFFRSAKKYFYIFIPVLLFILFHSFYPSKQERFILPVLPLFIILGVLGFGIIIKKTTGKAVWNFSWKSFWILDHSIAADCIVAYSKKIACGSVYYF